jgi:hypothetical protein
MHLQCTYVVPEGWHLTIVMRRDGEPWSDAYRADYSHLASGELLDVLCEELAQLLR